MVAFFHFFGFVEVVADMVVEVEGVGGETDDTSENHRRRVKVAVATVDVARASWELEPMSERKSIFFELPNLI